MSQPRGFGLNGQALYTNIAKPIEVNLQFTVTATNGLGVTSLKSNGYVRNVFMHTSTTPTANDGYTNPNPATGYLLIQLKNNFNVWLSNFAAITAPTTTSTKIDNTALSVGAGYVITILGNATEAQWRTVGVPYGVTPAVGVSFIAIATTAGTANTSTSRVQVPTSSGAFALEVVGNPTVSANSTNISSYGGAWVLAQFLAPTFTAGAYTPTGTVSQPTLTMNSYTPAGTNNGASPPIFSGTPATLTGTVSQPTFTGAAASLTGTLAMARVAPTDGSIVSMAMKFDGSTVSIDGL